jgi:hypothetical protein
MICVFDAAGKLERTIASAKRIESCENAVIETHQHAGEFKEWLRSVRVFRREILERVLKFKSILNSGLMLG